MMRILMYHDIVPDAPKDIHSVSAKQFAAQMQWLDEAGYHVTTVEEWFAGPWSPGRTPKKGVTIIFDDGYQSNYTLAWPILASHGFVATTFLVTGALGGESTWREGELARAKMLSEQEILTMADEGIVFGSHTVTHVPLAQLSDPAVIDRELTDSKSALEQLLGREVISLCYPYSAVNPEIKRRARAAGYRLALTYEPGYVGAPGRDPYEQRRIGILASDTLDSFIEKVRATVPLRVGWYLRRLKQHCRRAAEGLH